MITHPEGSTILITGGAGFVGSSFALHWKLRYPGSKVIALDNLKRRGSELNLPRLKQAGIEFIHGDVREPADLKGIPTIDALIECSAEPSVLAGYGGGSEYVFDTNLKGTVNCLDLIARDKADMVFLSTSRVYPIHRINSICRLSNDRFELEPRADLPGVSREGISEDFPLQGVRSLYGTTKLCSELLIAEYADIYGIRTVINRCGVIAGPWQMGKTDQGFVLLWLSRHHWGAPLNYTGFGGKGAQVRDVLHIADLCELVTMQLENMEAVNGEVFNAGGGLANSASLREFTEIAMRTTGKRIEVGNDDTDRAGDLKSYITDNSKITRTMGWSPKKDLGAVFADSYTWLKENEHQLRTILS